MKELTIIQGTDAWHKWRRDGIGATAAAIINGYSAYTTPLEYAMTYHSNLDVQPKSAFAEWGIRLEPLLIDKLIEKYNLNSQDIYRGELYQDGILRCSLDARYNHEYIIECKTGQSMKYWMGGKIPEQYYAQVQFQMYVTGLRAVRFSVLIRGYQWFSIYCEYNESFAKMLVESCLKYWDDLHASNWADLITLDKYPVKVVRDRLDPKLTAILNAYDLRSSRDPSIGILTLQGGI